jgi:hypothetical protein
MHDVHSRLTPKQAIVLARALEPYRLSFLEDVIAPEHYDRLPEVRAASPVPIAVGEQIGSVPEAVRLIRDVGVDLLRLHTSAVGGLTPTRKLAALAELLGVSARAPLAGRYLARRGGRQPGRRRVHARVRLPGAAHLQRRHARSLPRHPGGARRLPVAIPRAGLRRRPRREGRVPFPPGQVPL